MVLFLVGIRRRAHPATPAARRRAAAACTKSHPAMRTTLRKTLLVAALLLAAAVPRRLHRERLQRDQRRRRRRRRRPARSPCTPPTTRATSRRAEAPAGTLTFDVTNTGSQVTEFYLLGEDGLRIVAEVENVGPNLSRELTVNAPAGTYLTACKPGMDGEGIRADFTVTDVRRRARRSPPTTSS